MISLDNWPACSCRFFFNSFPETVRRVILEYKDFCEQVCTRTGVGQGREYYRAEERRNKGAASVIRGVCSYHKRDEDQAGGTRMLQEKPPQVRRRIRDNEEECAEEKTRGSLEYAPVDGARNILTFSEQGL